MKRALLPIALIFLAQHVTASVEIRTSGKALRQGEETRLVVLDDGRPIKNAEIRAVYRPASRVETERSIGVTDGGGAVSWTPEFAGIVKLTVERGEESFERTVPVKFPSPPASGLAILAFAALVLFGGLAYLIVRVRRMGEYHYTPPPDS